MLSCVLSDRFFFQNDLMIFSPFPTDSVDDAQVSSKKVMSPDHPIVKHSFTLSIARRVKRGMNKYYRKGSVDRNLYL